jgi:hypothetical protein
MPYRLKLDSRPPIDVISTHKSWLKVYDCSERKTRSHSSEVCHFLDFDDPSTHFLFPPVLLAHPVLLPSPWERG